jgi:hypothetical protein
MLLLDAPYVSDFLKKTIETLKQPVLDSSRARAFAAGADVAFIDDVEFARRLQSGERVCANSENSLDLVARAVQGSDLVRQIEICKDKALFRETIAFIHPDYRFMRVDPDYLDELDISDMPIPFVIKPTRGFFSLGVHMVSDHDKWPGVVRAIKQERETLNAEYPEEVVDSGEFLIEEALEGEEYAIDVYFDGNGEPVILNILYHQFASEDDVSDRLYYTSADIVGAMLKPFTEVVARIGQACDFRDFPIHLEVRVDEQRGIVPIEANPLRFAGWGVADLTAHAWGFNPYEYYFNDMRPDWPAILEERSGKVFAMVIGDVPAQIDRTKILDIDYDGFCDQFEKVLELRKVDHASYPLFALVFVQVDAGNIGSLKAMLKADFSRFIVMAS